MSLRPKDAGEASTATPKRGPGKAPLAALLLPAAVVAAPLAAPWIWRVSRAGALGGMAASQAAFLYGSLRANCPWFGPVVTRFVPDGGEIWLTIDDGPTPEDTPRLLDLLDGAGARATFFVRGDLAQRQPELVREIARRGHGLGNHTYSHPQGSFWAAPPWTVAREIDRCSEALRAITGRVPDWFRVPVGMGNPFVHRAVAARGLRMIGWSDRGLDTLGGATVQGIVGRIMRGLRPGGIVLLHEGRRNAAGEQINVQAAAALLKILAERGWRSVVPDEARLLSGASVKDCPSAYRRDDEEE